MNITNEALKVLVIEDHELFYEALVSHLQQKYTEAEFISAKTALEAEEQVSLYNPDLVLIDLSLPSKTGEQASPNTGIQLLKSFLERYPELNIAVQSAFVKTLRQIKSAIDNHEGGFTIADKGLATQDILKRVDWALEGIHHTRDLGRKIIELKPEWLELLRLAFDEALQDQAIANRMNVCLRTVNNYWIKIRDELEVYPEDTQNLRTLTLNRAREEGLIN